jgi:glycosyltransferase involved in cell wall biosynthesis
MKTYCLNDKYSTTRILTREKPNSEQDLDNQGQMTSKKEEGGLRTQGYFKASFKNKILITIVTVVLNGEDNLERTILSVLNQSYDNIEYIIVDGGSTDTTLDIIKYYNNFIDYWISEPDRGIFDAMNKGVLYAHGDYLLHLNSDDYLNDNIVSEVVDKIEKNPDFDIYHGSFLIHFSESLLKSKIGHGFLPTSMPAYQPASFISMLAIGKRNWFDTNYKVAADFKFFKSLQIKKYRYFKLDLVVSHFSVGGASSNTQLRMLELKSILIELGYPKIIASLLIFRIKLTELARI